MKVVIFGATGMVGQNVLRECLLDPDVESVLTIVRKTSLPQHVNFAKSYIKMFLISRRLRTRSPASTHAFSVSVSRRWG